MAFASGSRNRHALACVILASSAVLFSCGGDPSGPGVIQEPPAKVSWSSLGAGVYNSCAATSAGTAYCWGFDLVAGCANGCVVNSIPTRVAGSPVLTSVTTGGGYSCGTTAIGELWCWGELPFGSLGDGVTKISSTPVKVAFPGVARSVSAGYGHACALDDAGVAYCWGSDALGFAAAGGNSSVPKPVTTSLRFSSISAGNTQTCAIAKDDTAYCWGSGYGSLGIGARDTACSISASCASVTTPALVDGGLHWSSISAGNAFTCGVTVDQKGYCWGEIRSTFDPSPPYGVLGSGKFEGSLAPVPVAGGLSFATIATGTRQACGITTEGSAYCWGDNELAELGIGESGGKSAVPRAVAGGLHFAALSLADHSCGLTTNNNIYCWGWTYGGALGNGEIGGGRRPTPTLISPPHS